MIRKLLPFFRKMNVILFASFMLYSAVFMLILSESNKFSWRQSFKAFQTSNLEKTAYLFIDDLHRENIVSGPLTESQRQWLARRAILYGMLLRFENKERTEVWFDSFAKAGHPVEQSTLEVAYVATGSVQGYLQLEYILDGNDMEPAYVDFKAETALQTKLLLLAILISSVLLSYWIARGLSRHLNNVSLKATNIGMGARDVAIPLKGPEEVRKLAATLNEMNGELKKQEDWRHNLMEDITHELRTPLTSLQTQVEAIVDGVYEPDTERMQDIYEELIRLSRLVNDLERLSEAESARFSMIVRRTNMVDLTRKVHSNFIPLARSKSIKLTYVPAYVPCYADVDHDKIVQVVSNLVLNAIKYTPEGGKVTLSVTWNTEHTIIVCEDTGVGISEKDLPYIFNRLYRVDKSRSRFSGGVGLGLSIAKALVEAHNGTIEAHSELGTGSRFFVHLPNKHTLYSSELS